MPPTASSARDLQNLAALWSIGGVPAVKVVDAACDALVAGLDSPTLRSLAACTRAEADFDVPELVPEALDELGLDFHPYGSDAGREAAARALAGRMLADEMSPRELAFRIHQLFGHGLPLAEPLADLDDVYDSLGCTDRTVEEVDAEVVAEARRLADHP
ncbi:hypothetical protein [Streptomyces albireticuli]|uniref:hypothetical protein n=1 Tax=Streptomyces albireticuli TaxID=1940 RepID=UPI0036B937CC